MADAPALSVIVVISSDTIARRADVSHLEGCLEALSLQLDAPAMEIIVPHHQDVDGIEELSARFASVAFVAVPASISDRRGGGREHHDVLRAHGIKFASGDVIALLEDYARPDPTWSANVVAAHRRPSAAIGGAIENGIDRPLNWAVYFCDFGKYQNPLPAGPAPFASDINTSYKRAALEAIRPLWGDSYREPVVNGALISRGHGLVLDPKIVVHHHRPDLGLSFALRERFIWGRSYAVARRMIIGDSKRYLYAALCLGLPFLLLARMARTTLRRRRNFTAFFRALPHLAPLLIFWSAGEMIGYLARPSDAGLPRLAGCGDQV